MQKTKSQSMLAAELLAAGDAPVLDAPCLDIDYKVAIETRCEVCPGRYELFEPFIHPTTGSRRIVIRCSSCRHTTEM